ncbi:MAG: hypothetical protein ABSC64_12805 [Candidatus Korobacteraceae bacterium]
MRELTALLQSLMARQFFGSIEIQFKQGDVVLVRLAETLKPPYLTNNSRETRNGERER